MRKAGTISDMHQTCSSKFCKQAKRNSLLCGRGRISTCIQLLSLFLLFSPGHSSKATILYAPVFGNVIENQSIVMPCTVQAEQVSFLVNGEFADNFIESGFMLSSILNNMDNVRERNLTVLGSTLSNNSLVQCIAFNTDNNVSVVRSEEVEIQVQGRLCKVVGLSYSFINSSTVNISWSPPFTLPGTDIFGYNVSVTSNGTTAFYFTSNSYILVDVTTLKETAVIIVSGFNGLNGRTEMLSIPLDFEQERSTTTVASQTTFISPSTATNPFNMITTSDIITNDSSDISNDNQELIVTIAITIPVICLLLLILISLIFFISYKKLKP